MGSLAVTAFFRFGITSAVIGTENPGRREPSAHTLRTKMG